MHKRTRSARSKEVDQRTKRRRRRCLIYGSSSSDSSDQSLLKEIVPDQLAEESLDKYGNLKGLIEYSEESESESDSEYFPGMAMSGMQASSRFEVDLEDCEDRKDRKDHKDHEFYEVDHEFYEVDHEFYEVDHEADHKLHTDLEYPDVSGHFYDNVQDEKLLEYYHNLPKKEQKALQEAEHDLLQESHYDTPLKVRILRLTAPKSVKARALQQYNQYLGDESGAEYGKFRRWLEYILNIPWGQRAQVPIQLRDGYPRIMEYLGLVQRHLDQTIYGQSQAKSQILELLAQWIVNPDSRGLVLGFQGPPGTGKTSFMREGVAWALQRPFVTLALGGARCGDFLDGSEQVFEGASAGKIVSKLIQAQSMNPIFYFDELDKLSKSVHGEEVSNVLLHLTDPAQNHDFQDKYLGVGLDLSEAVYIFSYNHWSQIDPILRDRIKNIHFQGYSLEEKIQIAQNYSLPKILREWGFHEGEIQLPKRTLEYLIQNWVSEEPGMRGTIHTLQNLVSKLNLLRCWILGAGSRTEKVIPEKGTPSGEPETGYKRRVVHFDSDLESYRHDTPSLGEGVGVSSEEDQDKVSDRDQHDHRTTSVPEVGLFGFEDLLKSGTKFPLSVTPELCHRLL